MSSSDDVIRIASANMEEGGIDADGSRTRWEHTVAALADWSPDVVCIQEMAARRDPLRIREHLWGTANALGMTPVLGSEGGISGNHPVILVDSRSLVITDEGPPPRGPGHDPAWCEAVLWPSPAVPLRVYSVHLSPGSSVRQLMHAQQLANRIAQRGELAVAAGDWNCYPPDPPLTAEDLAALPPHLRPARMHARPGQPLAANYDVHDTLVSIGMIDAAAGLEPARRDPRDLAPTGINGGGRVDRAYVTGEIWDAAAVLSYAQKDGGGSDHQMFMITLGLAALASAAAPGFRP